MRKTWNRTFLILGCLLLLLIVAVAACSKEEADRVVEPASKPTHPTPLAPPKSTAPTPAPTAASLPSRPVPPLVFQQSFAAGIGTSEEVFRSLLTDEDVSAVAGTDETLSDTFYDLLELASFSDPAQIAAVETFYGLTFETRDGKALSLTLIDFNTSSSANGHFTAVVARTGIQNIGQSVGDQDFSVELNADGLWAIFGFVQGDKAVQLQTLGSAALTDLRGLKELARIVEQRL